MLSRADCRQSQSTIPFREAKSNTRCNGWESLLNMWCIGRRFRQSVSGDIRMAKIVIQRKKKTSPYSSRECPYTSRETDTTPLKITQEDERCQHHQKARSAPKAYFCFPDNVRTHLNVCASLWRKEYGIDNTGTPLLRAFHAIDASSELWWLTVGHWGKLLAWHFGLRSGYGKKSKTIICLPTVQYDLSTQALRHGHRNRASSCGTYDHKK